MGSHVRLVFELIISISCDLVLELQFAMPCALQYSNNCVLLMESEGEGEDMPEPSGVYKCNFKV